MTSLRRRKAAIGRAPHGRSALEIQLWDRMPPVGREFGSPDFDRLVDGDRAMREACAPANFSRRQPKHLDET